MRIYQVVFFVLSLNISIAVLNSFNTLQGVNAPLAPYDVSINQTGFQHGVNTVVEATDPVAGFYLAPLQMIKVFVELVAGMIFIGNVVEKYFPMIPDVMVWGLNLIAWFTYAFAAVQFISNRSLRGIA